ncbi:MAG: SurA N-terminal domain-containing protein [Labilithrix sp.]|nr:SurA N-terminal domain-containing protein [Labilithrix sp.]MCW5811318.1 SurA N-terminal domain-containing protein [Labilithrix sp.]
MLRRIAVLAAVLLAPSLAQAETPVLLDRIVAQIDAYTIYRSDVVARTRPHVALLAKRNMSNPKRHLELARQVLDEMIDDKLVEKDCARVHIGVEKHEIEAAIDEIARSAKTDRATLFASVRAQGFSEETYRAELRRQLMEAKWTSFVVRPRVQAPVTGTEEEKKAAVEALLTEEKKKLLQELRGESFIEVRW